ncbi:BamA/TamA family outer membrane protein [Segetibacter aerophilus]|uniref:Bacterial surface antigen (D15) domain-containing protein n=1 Tax=Segetibacter aerophilus TaxID=670293 RepID=A0A512BE38_9BACT|nr:BamA/TamA family outer membrane protein [Segetibacter aerophilus]GEO10220.1 hypothetical protein SAE01_27160 [Segetibacter aerophilus]
MRCDVLPLLLLTIFLHVVGSPAAIAQKGDSITVAIAPEYDNVSKAHRVLFGETYRKLWATPVKIRIIHLQKEKGGLTIVEKGGGLQTKSLKLSDTSGKAWVLRSIQKYPERALPQRLKATIAKDILQDQVATGHPFAALTVPPFAAALGIPHSNPEIVYLADDPALGEFRQDFANSVLLLEERDPLTATDTDNAEKVEEKLEKDHNNRVDQKLVLRARLLDLFLGDWDRHEGQWRWEEKKEDSGSLYLPIPRDRDKVYYNTAGIFPWLLSRQSLKSNLQGFHNDVRDIRGYNFNNRYFDRIFLNELSEADWKEQISYVQNMLTDDLIKTAVRRLPGKIYTLTGNKIINTLIARRTLLAKQAMKYFEFISEEVDVHASDKSEQFEIEYLPYGNVAVTISKNNKNSGATGLLYKRVFDHRSTNEIRLHALGGDDVFTVKGVDKSPIKIRMIGGVDTDSFFVASNIRNKRKLYAYDRSDEQNKFPSPLLARIKTASDSSINEYNKHSFKYDKLGPAFSFVYTIDQGMLLRAGVGYEKHGFRKEPFAEKHMLSANYGTERHSYMFEYSGYLTKVIYGNDLSIDFLSKGPNYTSNFFGVGNETQFVNAEGKDIRYYRNQYNIFSAEVKLHRHINKNFTASAGFKSQYYTSSPANNKTHFFQSYNAVHPDDNVFDNRFYTGVVAGTSVDTRNNGLFSSKGIFWATEVTALKQLNGGRKSFAQVFSEFNFYVPLTNDSNIVIANRIGAGATIGTPAFFQQFQLGGVRNLRGFHTYRFTGKSMFFYNLDLRCKLFDFNSYLFPGTVGVVGFNDIGRVWVPGEASKKWHDGYGGGIYIIPAELILIQAIVGHSVEGTLPYISIGFTF